jgi:hypothetical protein
VVKHRRLGIDRMLKVILIFVAVGQSSQFFGFNGTEFVIYFCALSISDFVKISLNL